jgi:hypothetical protein
VTRLLFFDRFRPEPATLLTAQMENEDKNFELSQFLKFISNKLIIFSTLTHMET